MAKDGHVKKGPVAQLVEQQTFNLRVTGSIPVRLTKNQRLREGRGDSFAPVTNAKEKGRSEGGMDRPFNRQTARVRT